jgi:RHS repeat-associated protein
VYVSNESDVLNYVHFDDFSIYHAKTNVVSGQSYYPFGGHFSAFTRTASEPQRFLYNAKELQEDLGLNLQDFGRRMRDPWGGPGFISQDRFAEKYFSLSPYQFAAGNPIMYVDANGDSLIVNGSNSAQQTFETIVMQGMGGHYEVGYSASGKVVLNSTGIEGEMTKEQQRFYDVFNEAIVNSKDTSFDLIDHNDAISHDIHMGDNGASILTVTPGRHTIDVGDAQVLGTRGKLKSFGVITHEIKEGFEMQVNETLVLPAHGKGIAAESKVNGIMIVGIMSNGKSRINVTVVDANQEKSIVTLNFKKGNLKKIKDNE